MSNPILSIEGIRAALGAQNVTVAQAQNVRNATPDAKAVEAFQGAMGATAPQATPAVDNIAAAWDGAQTNYQGIVHRIKALTEMRMQNGPSIAELSALQYEVATLAFQQEVVTSVAKKSSDAVQTLIKNG